MSINAIIKFMIVALAIFWLLRVLTTLRVRAEAAKGPTPTEALLAEIRGELRARPKV
jgi:large conductance mechanosensitive channel